MQYTILLQWSDEDNCFVVFLPEFTNVVQPCTHGNTYLEAVQNAQEVIELLVESAIENGEPLPKRQKFQTIPVSQAA
jgi:predicted RNase H-like HicB family nuclease